MSELNFTLALIIVISVAVNYYCICITIKREDANRKESNRDN